MKGNLWMEIISERANERVNWQEREKCHKICFLYKRND